MKLSDFAAYRITKMQNNQLAKVQSDPWTDLPISKQEARKELSALHERLADLQQRFFVDRRKKLLFVLQGMDTSGKNGSIRHVFRGVNPQGVHVASFGKPSTREPVSYTHLTLPTNREV